jgi:hypothetical protein
MSTPDSKLFEIGQGGFIDAPVFDCDTLTSQQSRLLAKMPGAFWENNTAACAHHSMPWEVHVLRHQAQRFSGESRTTGQTGGTGNIAVAGDLPSWDARNHVPDRLQRILRGRR